jgi:hypothetical protein
LRRHGGGEDDSMTRKLSLRSSRPFRRRTWIRSRLPRLLVDRGSAGWKDGDDCEAALGRTVGCRRFSMPALK